MPISAPLAADLAALRLETYPIFSADRVAPRINWKFAVDTFLEGYHIPHLHRKTIAPYFIGNCRHLRRRRPARPHVRGADLDRRACASCPRASAITARTSSRSTSSSPTPSLIWQVDHIEIWRAFPDRDDRQPLRRRDDDLQARRQRRGPTPIGRRTATSPSAR